MHPLSSIVKNLDFAIRTRKAKSILVASDHDHEGKSTFIRECAPLLSDLYERKVLIYDCQHERGDLLEAHFTESSAHHQFIRKTDVDGLDYIHADDIFFLDTLPQPEKISSQVAYYNELSKGYDVVLINMKTYKRQDKTTLPALPIDGAVLIRSKKSLQKKNRPITEELEDRQIPILGLILNEGV